MGEYEQKFKKLRDEIDVLDRSLFRLLKKRFRLVREIGDIKKREGLPVFQKARWEAMLREHVKRGQEFKLDKKFIKDLMVLIHKESVKIQRKLREERK